jgi:hypothetical protein
MAEMSEKFKASGGEIYVPEVKGAPPRQE